MFERRKYIWKLDKRRQIIWYYLCALRFWLNCLCKVALFLNSCVFVEVLAKDLLKYRFINNNHLTEWNRSRRDFIVLCSSSVENYCNKDVWITLNITIFHTYFMWKMWYFEMESSGHLIRDIHQFMWIWWNYWVSSQRSLWLN